MRVRARERTLRPLMRIISVHNSGGVAFLHSSWFFIYTDFVMAEFLREYPELEPFWLSNVQLTGTRIGAGAYGSVEEVTIPGAICAAKRIHDVFLDGSTIPAEDIRKSEVQFVRECQLMSTLRHPHIVQFMGVCFLPGSRLPALVMERLLTSLHDLLVPETDTPNATRLYFPLSLKCNVLQNVACGLAYLHELSPPVIHRDLSARNVLLNSGMVAKIADLGVARIILRMNVAATMTKGPGSIVYMPPEAVEDKPGENEEKTKAIYDASIDVFSYGVVAIFTLSQRFPDKLLAPTYREGGQHKARTELERRERYMRAIYRQLRQKHPLIQLIKGCLDFPENRPSIREVMSLLEEAKAEEKNDQMDMNKLELLQALKTSSWKKENVELEEQFRIKEEELERAKEQIRVQEEQLQSSEALVAELQKNLDQLTYHKGGKYISPGLAATAEVAKGEKLAVQCYAKATAPCEMERGSAIMYHDSAYCMPNGSNAVYQYECSTEKWEKLPPCPSRASGLIIIDTELTAVGGEDQSDCTNKLLTLQNRNWVEKYPPMNVARSSPAVVATSNGNSIIVIGGQVQNRWIATVELFQVRSRKWYFSNDTLKPLSSPSAAICRDNLCVIGADYTGYCCSLGDLQSRNTSSWTWTSLPSLPVMRSTVASLSGEIIIVGGWRLWSAVNSMHQLVDGQWKKIGAMANERCQCLLAGTENKIIIVGGYDEDHVEECVAL